MIYHPSTCIYGDPSDQQITTLRIYERGRQNWLCSHRLPVLILNPFQLTDKVPELEIVRTLKGHI